MNTIWSMRDYVIERMIEIPGKEDMYTIRFATMDAILKAARELIGLYEQWETQHFTYLDVNLDAFVFDSKTGIMTFKDRSKVVGRGMELTEEQRVGYYSAPELILGTETVMTTEAQNWTLAMLLFDLLYHAGHPLSGAASHTKLFLSEEEEYRWYATDGIFNMEEVTCKNRPIHGIQGHLIKYWDFYPSVLQEAFTETFLYGKTEKERRYTINQWYMVINEIENQMPCNCGYKGFVNTYRKTGNGNCVCPKCGRIFYTLASENKKLYISEGTQILKHQFKPEEPKDNTVIAMVVENKQRKGLFGIKVNTKEEWEVTFPNQSVRKLTMGQGAPLWSGLSIVTADGTTWSLVTEDK